MASNRPLRETVARSRTRVLALLVVGLLLLAVGLVSLLWVPRPATHRVRITGGIPGLNRHAIAEYMRRHAGEIGLDVEVVLSEGTSDAVGKLQSRAIDLALVNGLLRSPQATSVRQVATITVEAMHLLVKEEHAVGVAEDFGKLAGLSVNAGPPGSETELMAKTLLRFCGIPLPGDAETPAADWDRQGIGELLATLDDLEDAAPDEVDALRADLPDVVVHVSTLPSPLARRFIRTGGYELIPLPFADAFSRITVEEEDLDRDHVDQVHVVPTTIPAYMYGATPAVPPEDYPTLGCPLLLVVHEEVPRDVVSRLMPRIFGGPLRRVYDPPSLDDVAATYPLHEAAIAYRDRDKPLVRADIVEGIQQVFSVVAPLFGGCLALFGYYRWRQTLRFMEYFEEYQSLDLQAKGLLRDEIVTPAEAEEAGCLEAQLTRLQQRAVTDFCNNYFHGDGVLENFLQLLAETRDFLRASARQATAPPDTVAEPPATS